MRSGAEPQPKSNLLLFSFKYDIWWKQFQWFSWESTYQISCSLNSIQANRDHAFFCSKQNSLLKVLSWAQFWGRLITHLEELSPCGFIPGNQLPTFLYLCLFSKVRVKVSVLKHTFSANSTLLVFVGHCGLAIHCSVCLAMLSFQRVSKPVLFSSQLVFLCKLLKDCSISCGDCCCCCYCWSLKRKN